MLGPRAGRSAADQRGPGLVPLARRLARAEGEPARPSPATTSPAPPQGRGHRGAVLPPPAPRPSLPPASLCGVPSPASSAARPGSVQGPEAASPWAVGGRPGGRERGDPGLWGCRWGPVGVVSIGVVFWGLREPENTCRHPTGFLGESGRSQSVCGIFKVFSELPTMGVSISAASKVCKERKLWEEGVSQQENIRFFIFLLEAGMGRSTAEEAVSGTLTS
ncbi:uncharacterized protein LOC113967910 [Neopelma chrysocephalum]|uniref:uncharacterized protein LOC113967910 n=1 Tax=Neopelma chrysocephalum TaxID=114329 RepID=UPI000FCD3618|nr:uncharacterized protein LOC113967910 [Neopelma chrysocephalum]